MGWLDEVAWIVAVCVLMDLLGYAWNRLWDGYKRRKK